MKKHIKQGLTALLVGFSLGVLVCIILETIESTIVKIELIRNKDH